MILFLSSGFHTGVNKMSDDVPVSCFSFRVLVERSAPCDTDFVHVISNLDVCCEERSAERKFNTLKSRLSIQNKGQSTFLLSERSNLEFLISWND